MISDYQKDVVMAVLNTLSDQLAAHPEDHGKLFGMYNYLANAFNIPLARIAERIPESAFSHAAQYRTSYQ